MEISARHAFCFFARLFEIQFASFRTYFLAVVRFLCATESHAGGAPHESLNVKFHFRPRGHGDSQGSFSQALMSAFENTSFSAFVESEQNRV